MGVAAYNRGTKVLSAGIDCGQRAAEFLIMDELNSLPKDSGAFRPFSDIVFSASHGAWWATCPVSGFGYHFPTLRAAVRAFLVEVHAYDETGFHARPLPKL
jgi:hypothetical protein